MPAEAHGTAGGTLGREQVLDELELLTTVEHALIVEYLWVSCALGHDLPAEEGGAATTQGHDVAVEAAELAVLAMFRLKALNLGLVEAGRAAQLGRAASICSDSVAEIALGPPSSVQLDRLLEREEAIASAIEERYARLRPAVTSDPVFEGSLLDHLRAVIVEDGPTHAAALAELRELLRDAAPADPPRATRREPAEPSSGASWPSATEPTTSSCPPSGGSSPTRTSSSRGTSGPWPPGRCRTWTRPTACWSSGVCYPRSLSPEGSTGPSPSGSSPVSRWKLSRSASPPRRDRRGCGHPF